jgi:hypothetical protein
MIEWIANRTYIFIVGIVLKDVTLNQILRKVAYSCYVKAEFKEVWIELRVTDWYNSAFSLEIFLYDVTLILTDWNMTTFF